MSGDGLRIATYEFGEEAAASQAPIVLAVHGFASSGLANWTATGWTRDLVRSGYRVIALDQRGHGASDRPDDPEQYTMRLLVDDVLAVMDAYLLDEVALVGYSLGARVGWHAAIETPTRITAAVLGGIPDGDPLTRFDVPAAREHLEHGSPLEDRLTRAYVEMAAGIPGNDLGALVSLVEGMRGGPQPDPAAPPAQPLLFATGSEDPILEASRSLAAACPQGDFVQLAGRNHVNAPTSRHFREAAIRFLQEH